MASSADGVDSDVEGITSSSEVVGLASSAGGVDSCVEGVTSSWEVVGLTSSVGGVDSGVEGVTSSWEVVGLACSWAKAGTTAGVRSKASPTTVAESDLKWEQRDLVRSD
ncbi:MAG: hypothetical protein ACHBN1_28255 [Heteroscytonema crispum UTEX LB 1556]